MPRGFTACRFPFAISLAVVLLPFYTLGCAAESTSPAATPIPLAASPSPATSLPLGTTPRPVATTTIPAFVSPSTAAASPIPFTQLLVKGGEYFFNALDQIEAGLGRVSIQNIGMRNHNLKISRLKPCKTITDVKGVQDLNAVFLTADTFYGGLNSTSPGTSKMVVLELVVGDYVLAIAPPLSNLRDHDIAKGMAKALKITAPTNPLPAEPRTDQTVTLKDDAIVVPPSISAGTSSILALNQGTQTHQLIFLRMCAGKTLLDFRNAFTAGNLFQAADPVFWSPGTAEFSPGARAWLAVDFSPGCYIAWDDIAGLKNGPSPFTVTAR